MADEPTVTQAMIKACKSDSHGTMDRRAFMDRLCKLAGSGVAAFAMAPLLVADSAHAALVSPKDGRVATSDVRFLGATGIMGGYLAIPALATGAVPGILVIHEDKGLNDHIRDIARRLALEGYAALAVDFLSPLGGTPNDENTATEMISELKQADTVANAMAARSWLAGHPRSTDRVAAIGFDWGGSLVNQLAVADPDLHYAGLDERINSGLQEYRSTLLSHDKVFAIHVYPRVNHSFANDTSAARYSKQAADLAWTRTLAFLKGTMF